MRRAEHVVLDGCAFLSEDFVKAIKATGKKQLIIAGVVSDAFGTFNLVTRDAARNHMSSAGAQLMNGFGTACELHRDWRNDVEGLAKICSAHIPDYRNLMTSYNALTGNT